MLGTPEDDSPGLPGAGGAQPFDGSGGTFVTAGGRSGVGGGAGGAGGFVTLTAGTGGTGGAHLTGGAGGFVTLTGTGGTGGAHLTGGAGGTLPATGGAGGGFLGSCAYPSCLWNLIRDCAVVGQCTEDEAGISDGTTYRTELCCSNGVSELVAISEQGSRIAGTVAVTKNGSKCYDVILSTTADGSTVHYTWVDPSGQAVAKASILMVSSSTPTVVCANGESMEMTDECAPDGSQDADTTTGTCR